MLLINVQAMTKIGKREMDFHGNSIKTGLSEVLLTPWHDSSHTERIKTVPKTDFLWPLNTSKHEQKSWKDELPVIPPALPPFPSPNHVHITCTLVTQG